MLLQLLQQHKSFIYSFPKFVDQPFKKSFAAKVSQQNFCSKRSVNQNNCKS